MENINLNLDIDDLTFGQLEFLTDYTKRSAEDLIAALAERQFTGRDLVAILALATNPEDPEAGLEQVRGTKASEIKLVYPQA